MCQKTPLNTTVKRRTIKEPPDVSWNRIPQTCKEATKHILGLKEPNTRASRSRTVLELSTKQKKLCGNRESNKNKDLRMQLKREDNQTFKAMQKQLKTEKDKMLDLELIEMNKIKTTLANTIEPLEW